MVLLQKMRELWRQRRRKKATKARQEVNRVKKQNDKKTRLEENHPVRNICPICGGSCEVLNETAYDSFVMDFERKYSLCPGCHGTGYVWQSSCGSTES